MCDLWYNALFGITPKLSTLIGTVGYLGNGRDTREDPYNDRQGHFGGLTSLPAVASLWSY